MSQKVALVLILVIVSCVIVTVAGSATHPTPTSEPGTVYHQLVPVPPSTPPQLEQTCEFATWDTLKLILAKKTSEGWELTAAMVDNQYAMVDNQYYVLFFKRYR